MEEWKERGKDSTEKGINNYSVSEGRFWRLRIRVGSIKKSCQFWGIHINMSQVNKNLFLEGLTVMSEYFMNLDRILIVLKFVLSSQKLNKFSVTF